MCSSRDGIVLQRSDYAEAGLTERSERSLLPNTVRPFMARFPYRIASGRPGEPDAPLNGSGVKMNINS